MGAAAGLFLGCVVQGPAGQELFCLQGPHVITQGAVSMTGGHAWVCPECLGLHLQVQLLLRGLPLRSAASVTLFPVGSSPGCGSGPNWHYGEAAGPRPQWQTLELLNILSSSNPLPPLPFPPPPRIRTLDYPPGCVSVPQSNPPLPGDFRPPTEPHCSWPGLPSILCSALLPGLCPQAPCRASLPDPSLPFTPGNTSLCL